MENCKLPRELLIEILARVPVRSLVRFKCVCKFFYNLIKNNNHFSHKHYEISKTKQDCALIEFRPDDFPYPNKIFCFLYNESESGEIGSTYLDIPNYETRYIICCHGLLCLIVGKGDFVINQVEVMDLSFDVLIWNPSTREIKALPSIIVPTKPPNTPPIKFSKREGFGFGLSKNMTWKVIMLRYYEDLDLECKDSYEIAMICSQVGDSWNWRQLNAVPQLPVHSDENFYLKGKYYWRVYVCDQEYLLWFDLDDEVFGTIELPCIGDIAYPNRISVTVMNETIALIRHPNLCTYLDQEEENYIEIWVINETNNSITWNKHASIKCGTSDLYDYFNPIGNYEGTEYWRPIGVWNLGGLLLVFPTIPGYYADMNPNPYYLPGGDNYIPYLISIDLITQKKKIIYLTQQRKSIDIVSNSIGFAQIYRERNVHIIEEWKNNNVIEIFPHMDAYVRVYSESLKFP